MRAVENLELRRSKSSPLMHTVHQTALWFASVGVAVLALMAGSAFMSGPHGSSAAPPPVASAVSESAAASDVATVSQSASSTPPPAAQAAGAVPATEDAVSVARPSRQYELPAAARYGVLVASFPIGGDAVDVDTAERIGALTASLEQLGYSVYHADVDLGARGRWRRVIAGAYAVLADGRYDESHIRGTRAFRDARLIALEPAEAIRDNNR